MKKFALSAQFVRSAPPGRYCDGDGLYLLVKKNLTKSWIFRYRVRGAKSREMGLGRAGEGRNCVLLAEAREKASSNWRLVKAGLDPLDARDAALAEQKAAAQEAAMKRVTFREVAREYIRLNAPGWKNAKHASQWESSLEAYVYPIFGDLPVAMIATDHVRAAIEPIWFAKPETASRVRGRIEKILDAAKTRGLRSGENPARWAGHLALLLPPKNKVARIKHHAALPWQDLPKFMSELTTKAGTGAHALQFAILTAARSGEIRGLTWGEIDICARVWVIPAQRMKAGREHRVPLSSAALTLLEELKEHRTSHAADALIFPGQNPTQKISDMTITAVLRRMGRADITVHGFRSTFRDWVSEATEFPSEMAEMALAHTISSKVEAAYRRGDMFEKRLQMMNDWADFCASEENEVSDDPQKAS